MVAREDILVNFFAGIGAFFRKFGDLKIDLRRFKRKDSLLADYKEKGVAMKKSGIELKDFVTSAGEKTAAAAKVKENYATEIESLGQFFSRTQGHMNSIIYALFIFAIILIGILGYLILKT